MAWIFFSIHCSVVVKFTATIDVAVIFAAKLANVNAALSRLYIGEVYVCGCGCLCYHKWVTAIFVQSKIFCSWMRLNNTKFGWYQNVEVEKSFKLYGQILVRVLTKVALNFIHFEYHCQKWVKCSKHINKIVKSNLAAALAITNRIGPIWVVLPLSLPILWHIPSIPTLPNEALPPLNNLGVTINLWLILFSKIW